MKINCVLEKFPQFLVQNIKPFEGYILNGCYREYYIWLLFYLLFFVHFLFVLFISYKLFTKEESKKNLKNKLISYLNNGY